jgi:transposase InsO family protein
VIRSDHGTQFTSWAFTENVLRLGLLSSMGTVGDCLFTGYSNVVGEQKSQQITA